MKKNEKSIAPRVKHIELPFAESIYCAARICREDIDNFKVKMVNGRVSATQCQDPVNGGMLYRMVTHILEAQPPKEIRYRYPLTWWDHFKEACFPAWALKRWPPVYKTETTVIKDIYPFPNIDLSESLGPVFRIARMSSLTEYPGGEDEP